MMYVALLRAVNVGGHNLVTMSDLRAMLGDLGYAKGQSLLQSGNLVFEASGRRSTSRLEAELERATEDRLGVTTDYFVRSAEEWGEIVAANPFVAEAREEPRFVNLIALKDAPSRVRAQALGAAIPGREVVKVVGRQAFALYPDGVGKSKLTPGLIEKHLGTRATGRNWNTVLKLHALIGA
jgi:uncharacterized protein (DUF1697 family)